MCCGPHSPLTTLTVPMSCPVACACARLLHSSTLRFRPPPCRTACHTAYRTVCRTPAIPQVGAATEAELEDRKLRIEDAKNATFAVSNCHEVYI